MRIWSAVLPLSVILTAVPGHSQGNPPADAEVLALVSAFSEARARFDAKAIDAMLVPDYVEVSPRGEVDRREAVLGFYAPEKATKAPPMTMTTEDVRRHGDTAIVVGSIEYTFPGPGGTPITRMVRATYVERRVGGRWLMASVQYTGVQPPLAPKP